MDFLKSGLAPKMAEAAAYLKDGPGIRAAAMAAAQSLDDGADLLGEYHRLFRTELAATPYETEYGPDRAARKGPELADILGFYEAFGFRPAASATELPDHIGAELEFFSLLLVKEADARGRGAGEEAAVAADAARKFLADHLGRWVPGFCRGLREAARDPFYSAVADLLEIFLEGEASRLGCSLGESAGLPPGSPEGCVACPMAPTGGGSSQDAHRLGADRRGGQELMKIADAAATQVRELFSEATAWRLIGLLFERPREGWLEEVEGLCREVSDSDIKAAANSAREEASEGLYLALLGPGSVVSPREVSYRGMEDPGHILADIKAFYEAFAFHPQTEEPPDHVSVEAGFLGYLTLKQAFARARGHEEEADIGAQAAERFRQFHLSTFAWPLADRLDKTEVRYLSLAARALAHRTGPRPATNPMAEGPLPPCDPDYPLDCGKD
jgi:TorA maturation chaperone TorD